MLIFQTWMYTRGIYVHMLKESTNGRECIDTFQQVYSPLKY
jgi:hypothetical protein